MDLTVPSAASGKQYLIGASQEGAGGQQGADFGKGHGKSTGTSALGLDFS